MSPTRRPSGATLSVGLALALLVAACTPPRTRNAGFNGYATDIVLGAQSRPTSAPLPPIPGASPNPGFPSFLSPAPPAPGTPLPPVQPPVTTKPVVLKCPQAPVDLIPPDAGTSIDKAPAAGVYPYKQSGFWTRPDGQKVSFPDAIERTLQNVKTDPNTGEITYDVVMTQLGDTTTMSYRTLRSGSAESDGIYMTRTVRQRSDGSSVEDFSPAPPGLRMFPVPPGVGTTFRSTATDGVHATSMTLNGAVREKTRIDACGELIEGWGTQATIHVLKSGIETGRTTKYFARYVVVPQLGGLIVADKVEIIATDSQDVALQEKPTTPPTTQVAQPTSTAVAVPPMPTTPQTTLPPRNPDNVLQLVETNIERLKPLRAPGTPAK